MLSTGRKEPRRFLKVLEEGYRAHSRKGSHEERLSCKDVNSDSNESTNKLNSFHLKTPLSGDTATEGFHQTMSLLVFRTPCCNKKTPSHFGGNKQACINRPATMKDLEIADWLIFNNVYDPEIGSMGIEGEKRMGKKMNFTNLHFSEILTFEQQEKKNQ